MNAVDPIKSLDDIRKMKEFLAKKPRNAMLFSFGINSGLRISDILALNVGDVRGKEYIEIRELKTGKRKIFPINDKLKQEIEEFTKGMPEEQPLFYTQKGRQMERSRAYKILNNFSCSFTSFNISRAFFSYPPKFIFDHSSNLEIDALHKIEIKNFLNLR